MLTRFCISRSFDHIEKSLVKYEFDSLKSFELLRSFSEEYFTRQYALSTLIRINLLSLPVT
jgi:hypothetical protein